MEGVLSYRIVIFAAVFLTGCNTTRTEHVFVRIDGKPTDQQLETDRTICIGDSQKAALAGTVISTGHLVDDISNDLGRDMRINSVMIGCMAEHGYKYIAVTSSN